MVKDKDKGNQGEAPRSSIFADLVADQATELVSDPRYLVRLAQVMVISVGALIGRHLHKPLHIDAAMKLIEAAFGKLGGSVLLDLAAAAVQVPKVLKPILQTLGLPLAVGSAADELVDGVFRGFKEAQLIGTKVTLGQADRSLQQGLDRLEETLTSRVQSRASFADIVAQLTPAEDGQLSALIEGIEQLDERAQQQWVAFREHPIPLHYLQKVLEMSAPAALKYLAQRMADQVPRTAPEVVEGAVATVLKTAAVTARALDKTVDVIFGDAATIQAAIARLRS